MSQMFCLSQWEYGAIWSDECATSCHFDHYTYEYAIVPFLETEERICKSKSDWSLLINFRRKPLLC